MALKHYMAETVSSGGTSRTILYSSGSGIGSKTVYVSGLVPQIANGGEMIVLGTRINGGDNGGELNMLNISSGTVRNNICFSIAANDVIYLDCKEVYTAGESLEIYGSEPGITVDVFADSSTANS